MTCDIASKIIDEYWKWYQNKITQNNTTFYPSNSCPVDKEYFVSKRQTAGILIAAHNCGIIVNFQELVTDEGLTQIANLIKDTGNFVKYVIYDNGCHLDTHLKNINFNYPEWMVEIKTFIDRFHIKNHIKDCQKYSCDKCDVTKCINSQVCEQLFYTIGKLKHITKHMHKNHFNFFLLQILSSLNKKTDLKEKT